MLRPTLLPGYKTSQETQACTVFHCDWCVCVHRYRPGSSPSQTCNQCHDAAASCRLSSSWEGASSSSMHASDMVACTQWHDPMNHPTARARVGSAGSSVVSPGVSSRLGISTHSPKVAGAWHALPPFLSPSTDRIHTWCRVQPLLPKFHTCASFELIDIINLHTAQHSQPAELAKRQT